MKRFTEAPDWEKPVADLIKNLRGDRLQISIAKFRGSVFVSMRTLYRDQNGRDQPGGGLNIRAHLLQEFRDVLARAQTVISAEHTEAVEQSVEQGDVA